MSIDGRDSGNGTSSTMLEDLQRLADEARALSGTVGAARRQHVRQEGRDGTGAVTAVVDGAGLLCRLEIDRSWTRRLSAEALGRALLEAYNDAARRAVMAALEVVQEADAPAAHSSTGEPRTTDLPDPRAAPSKADRTYGDQREFIDTLRVRLERIEAGFDELGRLKVRAAAERQRSTFCGPAALVHVTVENGSVVDVMVDERRLPYGQIGPLVDEALAAFRAAGRSAG